MKNIIIAPSVLASDFLNLGRDIQMLNESSAEWIHIDVMDGRFVPNISFGMPVLEAINKATNKFLDVHLMIVEPEKYFSDFAKYGANLISFHYEASVHHHRAIQEIKSLGCKAGIVLNPSTPVSVLEDIIEDLDLVLLMSVNPGFGGQVFIENTYKKIKDLVKLINSKGLENIRIEIDGGVNDKNSKKLIEAGADTLVAGSFVFKSENPINTIEKLLNYD
ncbi:MAG: hypothetical protein RIR51_174 [Bacteroidota bacterium]